MKKLWMLIFLFNSAVHATTPFVIGIAGGTGSGKTTFAKSIKAAFGSNAVLIEQDCYYNDLSHLDPEIAAQANFDHPDSIDFSLLHRDLTALKRGEIIRRPSYDFVTHSRVPDTIRLAPANIIIVEGILIFSNSLLRDLFDLKIFIETSDDVRILRRIERDMSERGRDFASIQAQYLSTVKPMHDQFVTPSKQFADIIILGDRDPFPLITLLQKSLLD